MAWWLRVEDVDEEGGRFGCGEARGKRIATCSFPTWRWRCCGNIRLFTVQRCGYSQGVVIPRGQAGRPALASECAEGV